ncbi:MAG: hypothetical protein J6K25_13330 [Thermoguttaceae bacterium]|nr:hypothetical protein [Thermoguttaceae bacterium]
MFFHRTFSSSATFSRNLLARRFGVSSSLFSVATERCARELPSTFFEPFESWRSIWRSISDASYFEASARSFFERRLSSLPFFPFLRAAASDFTDFSERLLFVLQTFAAQTIFSFVSSAFELAESERLELFGPTPFDWGASLRPFLDAATAQTLKELESSNSLSSCLDNDFLADFYARLFPAEARRGLGEFYTPFELVAEVVDRALFHFARPSSTDAPSVPFLTRPAETVRNRPSPAPVDFPSILDPTCGDGAFLAPVLRRRIAFDADPATALSQIAGFDLSPLAVLSARARLAFAASAAAPSKKQAAEFRRIVERRRSTRPNEPILPIFHLDAVRDRVPTLAASSETAFFSAPLPDYFNARRWAASPDFARRFDVVVGNPPWIAWDRLSAEYREATKERWRERGLFTLSGSAARHGGGKKELAGLLVYETLDRRLHDGGVLAFVVPKSLFQSRDAGNGFRRFGSNPDATRPTPFRVLEIDDFSEAPLFTGVSSKFATFCARRGEPTRYPIPVRRWRATEVDATPSAQVPQSPPTNEKTAARRGRPRRTWRVEIADVGFASPTSDAPGAPLRFDFLDAQRNAPVPSLPTAQSAETSELDALVERLFAENAPFQPLNRPTQTADFAELPLFADADDSAPSVEPAPNPAASPYVARLGANAAGASGVFWLENVERLDAPLVSVRNLGDVGRRKVETVEAQVESKLVFPLLRWRDVDEFAARRPTTAILLPQDPVRRRGIDDETMRRDFPAALAYLRRFETTLRDRAAYRKFQSRAPFWSLYNVDEATFAPIKVVWRRMDSTIRAAVVPFDEERDRPIIPQDTLSTVAVATLDEADYLAAVLNSTPVRRRVAASSVAGSKSFGSPGAFAALGVPRFVPTSPLCRALAELGRRRREEAEAKSS